MTNKICQEIIEGLLSNITTSKNPQKLVAATGALKVYKLHSTKYKLTIKCVKCKRMFVKIVGYYRHIKSKNVGHR